METLVQGGKTDVVLLSKFVHWKLEYTSNLHQKTTGKNILNSTAQWQKEVLERRVWKGMESSNSLCSHPLPSQIQLRLWILLSVLVKNKQTKALKRLPPTLTSCQTYSKAQTVLVNCDIKVFINSSVLLSHYYVPDLRLCILCALS